jgi:hypothetical protein
LANDFTSQSEGAPAKTYPASRKATLNQDKSTYTSGEQEQSIELSSFSMCSTLQSQQVIKHGLAKEIHISLLLILAQ